MDEKKVELKLEEQAQYGPDEAFEVAMEGLEEAVRSGMLISPREIQVISMLFREFLHWLYLKPGLHGTPASLLREARKLMPNVVTKPQKMND